MSLGDRDNVLNPELTKSYIISVAERNYHGNLKVALHNLEVKIEKRPTVKSARKEWRQLRRKEIREKIGLK